MTILLSRACYQSSKRKLGQTEHGELRASGIDITKALAGLQHRGATGQREIFRKWRAILHADAEVFANRVADVRLKEHVFQRLGAHEAQEIEVREALELRRDHEIRARVHQENSGIHEIRLTFFLAGTHAGQQAAFGGQQDAGTRQTNGFTVPETKQTAGKIRQIVDGIETTGAAIARVAIAGGIKRRNAVADPVAIQRKFRGGHLRIYSDGAPGDGIECVFANRLVEGVGEVQTLDVAAAQPAEITDANAMRNRSNTLINNISDGRGAHQETIVVVMDAGIVLVPSGDEFRSVAGEKEILQIDIAEKDLLSAAIKSVQAAVSIFLQQMKISGIVFDAVAVKIAEESQSGLFVDEKETPKIGVELLDAGAHGYKIIVGAQVVKLQFREGFLQADVRIEPSGALAHVRTDDAQFLNIEVVEANLGGNADAPIHGLEGSITMKEIEAEAQCLIEEELIAVAKKSRAAGLRGADAAGSGHAAPIKKGLSGAGEIEEDLLAQHLWPDWFIALEAIAVERVVPTRLDINVFALRGVATIVRLFERPAIGHGVEHVGNGRQHIGREFQDVVGVGIEAMAEFAIGTK